MPRSPLVQALACCLSLVYLPSLTVGQLQSVDEALQLSRKTGRPIFAMAGSKT
jgi:hypothetical protein